ncbi:hypothetical protein Rsub_05040 [Raphidocelis subcapitata]|uniref:FAD-binding PCMH-type domain-containing protein n=1 Tax=Raphidocelis subcapitata TaxID=307507 RepID=A0A2V0NYG0_9CHLO|nr:hypothetical protein Rsub_05040 [Raphidocelis subcapitata]|eukprot:GBF92671.1 hypothetical protein Rsub_05040 [Raphidocelis subcapitata]
MTPPARPERRCGTAVRLAALLFVAALAVAPAAAQGVLGRLKDDIHALLTPGDGPKGDWGTTIFSEEMLRICLAQTFNTSRAVWPEDAAYDGARKMAWGRSARPAAVVYAYSTEEVAAAVKCASTWGHQISAAGRRHSYQGWSVMSGYVVIDLSNITAIDIDSAAMTGKVGAGNTNGLWLAAVVKSGIPGAAALIGSCASVGVTGFVLGGGQGDISPLVGLGADQLLEAEVVTANGTVVTASKDSHPDLFWALRGGGGGLGIITRLTLKIARVPDPARVTWLAVQYAASPANTVDVMLALQRYLAKGDRRLGGGAFLQPGVYVELILLFLGSAEDAVRTMSGGGLLDPALLEPSKASSLEVDFGGAAPPPAWLPPKGVTVRQFPGYGYAAAQQSCSGYLQTPDGAAALGLPAAPFPCDRGTLDRVLGQLALPASDLNVGISHIWARNFSYLGTGGIQVRELPKEGWEALVRAAKDPGPDDGTPYAAARRAVKAGTQLGLNNHLTHGAAADVASDATAYRWRGRYTLITWDTGLASINHSQPLSKLADYIRACRDTALEIRAALEPYLTERDGGYYNYPAIGVRNFESFYWGANAARLAKVKAAWDPLGVFSKPSTVGPAGMF